ncbi:MAG: cell division topological specificity factor MinE [Gammaproteobacteria bacterium]|nr:cell division topological specificity factor MinE [Gammaproteobacteria bacterium]
MSILDYLLKRKKKSANIAKERLQIIFAAENMDKNGPDFLPELKRELLEVISRYVAVDQDLIQVNVERDSECDILELNIPLSGSHIKQKNKVAKAAKAASH